MLDAPFTAVQISTRWDEVSVDEYLRQIALDIARLKTRVD